MGAIDEQAPSFETDIRPLFRESDVAAMKWAFDLSAYEDVKASAGEIYARLFDGSMHCDARWPEDRVAKFKSWIDAGTPA